LRIIKGDVTLLIGVSNINVYENKITVDIYKCKTKETSKSFVAIPRHSLLNTRVAFAEELRSSGKNVNLIAQDQGKSVNLIPKDQGKSVSLLPNDQSKSFSFLPQDQGKSVSLLPKDQSKSFSLQKQKSFPEGYCIYSLPQGTSFLLGKSSTDKGQLLEMIYEPVSNLGIGYPFLATKSKMTLLVVNESQHILYQCEEDTIRDYSKKGLLEKL